MTMVEHLLRASRLPRRCGSMGPSDDRMWTVVPSRFFFRRLSLLQQTVLLHRERECMCPNKMTWASELHLGSKRWRTNHSFLASPAAVRTDMTSPVLSLCVHADWQTSVDGLLFCDRKRVESRMASMH